MEPASIEAAIRAVGTQVNAATTALTPIGLTLAGSFTVLSIIMLGAALMVGGGGLVPQIVRMTAAGAGTFWAISEWGTITRGTLDAARRAVGLLVGGYSGPTGLFAMAIDTSGRLVTEHGGFAITAPVQSLASAVAGALAAVFVLVGLSVTGLMAVLAELELLLGAAVAPLVLPALALGFTAPLGWGAVRYMVQAGLRVVVLGVVCAVMAEAIAATLTLQGEDEVLDWTTMGVLMILSLLALVVGLSASSVARDIAGSGTGSLGWGSTLRAAPVVAGTAAGAGGAIVAGGSAAAQGASSFAKGVMSRAGGASSASAGTGGVGGSGAAGGGAGATGSGATGSFGTTSRRSPFDGT